MKKIVLMAACLLSASAWGQEATSNKPYYAQPHDTVDDIDWWNSELEKMPSAAPPPPPKKKLGPIDKWRFESCQTDAAKAPTAQGVVIGMRVCREKFGQ